MTIDPCTLEWSDAADAYDRSPTITQDAIDWILNLQGDWPAAIVDGVIASFRLTSEYDDAVRRWAGWDE